MNNDNILDELIRSKLEHFEQSPPAYVWDRIHEKQNVQRKKRLFVIIRISGVAAAVLLAFVLGWQLQHNRQEEFPGTLVEQISGQSPDQAKAGVAESPGELSKPSAELRSVTETPEQKQAVLLGQINTEKESSPLTVQTVTETRESYRALAPRDARLESGSSPEGAGLAEIKRDRGDGSDRLSASDLAMIELNRKQLTARNEEKAAKAWDLGAMISPVYAINQSSYDAVYASNMTHPGSTKAMQLGGGVSVGYSTGKRWSIQSGLHYNQLGQSSSNSPSRESMNFVSDALDKSYLNTGVQVEKGIMQINASAGVVELDHLPDGTSLSVSPESSFSGPSREVMLTSANFDQQFEYVEIPLLVRYLVIDKIIDVQFLGGLNTGFLIGNNTYMEDGSGQNRIGSTKDMSRISYSTSIGLGLAYGLTEKLQLRIEPQLKYYLGSLSDNPSVNFKPYTIGVHTGLSYRF